MSCACYYKVKVQIAVFVHFRFTAHLLAVRRKVVDWSYRAASYLWQATRALSSYLSSARLTHSLALATRATGLEIKVVQE